MIQERRERRDRYDEDRNDRYDESRRRNLPPEVVYTFAANGRMKPPEVFGDRFRCGMFVSTSEGPHKVIEVYWWSATKARVLVRPTTEAEKQDAGKPTKKTFTSRKRTSRRS